MPGRGHWESLCQVVEAPGGVAMTEQIAGRGQRRGPGGETHGGHSRSGCFENWKQSDR